MMREGESIFGPTSEGVPSPMVYAPPPVHPMLWMTREMQGGDGAPASPATELPALWNLGALGGCGTCGQIRKVNGAGDADGLGNVAEAAGVIGFVGGAVIGSISGALVGALVGYLRTPKQPGSNALWGAGIGAIVLGAAYAVAASSAGAVADKQLAAISQRVPGGPAGPNGAPY